MTVAFRSYATLAFGARSNSTVNKPAATANDDILIAAFLVTAVLAVTAPAGWTEYSGSPFTSYGTNRVRFYRKRAASEGASWTWTHGSGSTAMLVAAYSGAITSGDPNDTTPTHNIGGSNTNIVATGITIATANALGVIFWNIGTSAVGYTPPAGFTEHGDPINTFGAADKLYTSTGATGNQTITTAGNNFWDTFFLAIEPPAAAPASEESPVRTSICVPRMN